MKDWLQDLISQYGVRELLTGGVLIVDDEAPNLDVLQSVLEPDYQVLVATSGIAGLHLAERQPLDIVITDQRMPNMTGVEMLERIRRIKPDVAGIVLTAYSDPPAIISAINQARAFRFLRKPWQPDDLLQAIAEARDHVYQTRAIVRLVDLLAKRSDELSAALHEVHAAQAQVLHMERLGSVGRFAAGVIHDLRNSLQGLMSLSTDLAEQNAHPDLVEAAHYSLAGLRNLLGQLESIYQYARSTRLEVEVETIEPASLIDIALKIARMDMKSRSRDIKSRILPGVPWIRVDRMKLVQVLINLLRNAVQATSDGQSITIEVSPAGDGTVLLAVEDEGPGIPAEIRTNLFRAFASSKAERGMGMGLYMSKLIIEAHGGSITCSDLYRRGTRIEIRIPAATARPDEASRPSPERGDHGTRRGEGPT